MTCYKSCCSIRIITFQLEASIFARLRWLNKSSYEDFFFFFFVAYVTYGAISYTSRGIGREILGDVLIDHY